MKTKKCLICGEPSGVYPLCKNCYFSGRYDSLIDDLDFDEEDEENQYSNIKSLYTFDSIWDFNEFTENLFDVENWEISDRSDEDRINALSKKQYFSKIKKDFEASNICPYPVSNKEILSYFDTLSLMYQIVNSIEEDNFSRNAKIIMEYVPKFDIGQDRCDYVIAYKNLLIIFEFGRCKNRSQIKNIRFKKESELEYYKSQIEKNVGKEIVIKTRAIIYQSETDSNAVEENDNEIDITIQQIENWLKYAYRDAIDYLDEK